MAEKLALNIFLLKRDRVAAFEDMLVAGHTTIPLSEPLDGFVLPLPARPALPRWVAVIQSVVQNPAAITLTGQSPAAIMVIRLDGDTFALTFGHAWQKLEDEWVEQDFGRRVALNSIAPDRLVEIHIEQVFANGTFRVNGRPAHHPSTNSASSLTEILWPPSRGSRRSHCLARPSVAEVVFESRQL